MTNKNGIVAFCGAKFSGKSTSATVFQEMVGTQTEEIAIAGHLKEVCARVFDIPIDDFLDPAKKERELDTLVVLDAKRLTQVLDDFDVKTFQYDKVVRPHIGRVIGTPRTVLQYIGTEVLHPIDPLIHVKIALSKKNPERLTLITDLRFPAEFDHFVATASEAVPFSPVYVKNTAAEVQAEVDGHASELGYKQFAHKCRKIDNEAKNITSLRLEIASMIGDLYG